MSEQRLIDANALKEKIVKVCEHINANNGISVPTLLFIRTIDNAPTVDIKDQIAGAYNEGYMCGNKEAEKARPQGEWVRKEDVIHSIAEQYSAHGELVPTWLRIGDLKGGAE